MGKYANFYNSKDGDRKYNADSFEEWLAPFFKNGVFNGELLVSSAGGFDVSVAIGTGYINGKSRKFDEPTTLTLDKANSTLARIDNIVVRRNDTDRNFTLEVVKGTESSSPVAPDLTREDGIYELCLARVYVGAAVVEITQSNITDTRMDSDLCGWVCATVEQIDFSQISLQWEQYLKEFKANNLEEFEEWEQTQQNAIDLWTTAYKDELDDFKETEQAAWDTWFANKQTELSGDVAGNLQLEIDNLNAEKAVIEDMIMNNDYRGLLLDESNNYVVDKNGNAILGNWKYKEA